MLFKDIKDDAKLVLGDCDGPTLKRRVTEAIDILANMGDATWDGMIGEITIAVDNFCGTVTLPREVLKPLSINIDGCPTFPRDKWFEYHLNGPGTKFRDIEAAWDEGMEVSVIREPEEMTELSFESQTVNDDGKTITIFYDDEDDRRQRETITLDFASPPETSFKIKRIHEVVKDETEGWVKMFYILPSPTLAGWYFPDERAPLYRRVRVRASNSIQMIYRRRSKEIIDDESYIPLRSKTAIMQSLWAIKYRYQGELQKAVASQQDGYQLLEQDQYARQVTNSVIGPQVLDYSTWNNERLKYDQPIGFRGGNLG